MRKFATHVPYVLAAIILGIALYPTFNRTVPVTYISAEATQVTVSPGELLDIQIVARWNRSCMGTSTFMFLDSKGVRRIGGTTPISAPPRELIGQELTYNITRLVPLMTPGVGYYFGVLRMDCSWLWPIEFESKRVKFIVKS